MSRVINAIYENGVFKPLEKVSFKEHEKVHIVIKEAESIALSTSGIIPAKNSNVIDTIALEPEFLPEEA